MPEVRTHLTIDLHRKLKGEAVTKGLPLKRLIADVLEKHAREQVSHASAGNSQKEKKPTR